MFPAWIITTTKIVTTDVSSVVMSVGTSAAMTGGMSVGMTIAGIGMTGIGMTVVVAITTSRGWCMQLEACGAGSLCG